MTKAGLIGTIVEEGSHVIGKVEGRQRKTGTDEKGLESTGRASNEYFSEKYKDDNPAINIQSDGKDYSNVDFGEHVGDDRGGCTDGKKTNIGCKGRKQKTWSELTPEEKSVEGEIVSTILNFVPYVGPAKIATEAIIGKDLITNKKMSYLDRVSSVLLQSKFHLGELNPKKIGTKKTKESHKEKPLRRKEKVDTSVSKSNPVTKKETMRDVTPKVKEPSTKGTPKSPAVKPVTKVEQNTETVKQPAVTSEKPKTVERSHSQGSNNHNSNKESFNQKTEKNPNRNPAGENFVEKSGGRKGNVATRGQNEQIADYLKNDGWDITGGGNKLPEEYLKGENGTKGSNYVDITATKYINGKQVTIRINTVDTYKRTGNLTNREAKAAEMINIKIKKIGKDPELITIPKGKGIENLEKELLKIEQNEIIK